ncbi:HAD family hydrolase [Mucilaginibacter ginkgonis]|uniref:HAD family phosphatase n=1 Tax=Mucilaginibacter ginkgonis TaxID=2682091 RepID=A0A6I4I6G1_9SPHI|nr:HAD family phosphatase [Mucilaginibacter ginkgonis]QQL50605.1 HAD family phosphatase [Mucilaginibacter ginkgonis]
MQNVKNIIFDYGNVIFMIDFNTVRQKFIDLGVKNVDSFFGHLQQDPVFDLLDRGDISAADFRDHVRELAGQPSLTDEQIDDAWNSILIGVQPSVHDVLLELKKKYRTFLLSNNNEIHYAWIMDYLQREFGMDGNDSLFEKTYYSHLARKRKPDAEMFNQVLQENGLVAEETLFVDDSPQHIASARKLGLQTYLMTAPDNIINLAQQLL